LLVTHCILQKSPSKFVNNISSYSANRQIDIQTERHPVKNTLIGRGNKSLDKTLSSSAVRFSSILPVVLLCRSLIELLAINSNVFHCILISRKTQHSTRSELRARYKST